MLNQQMDVLTLDYDQLQEAVIECTTKPRDHSLVKQVDEWERKAIEHVQEMASDARRQILLTLEKQTIRMNEDLIQLKQQLCRARQDEDFFESDLKEWNNKLGILRKVLAVPITINIAQPEKRPLAILPITFGICTPSGFFERSTGDIRIEDNGQLILHGMTSSQAAVRGRDELGWSQHLFRFKIESLTNIEWILFGVISKDAPVQEESYLTASSYGWGGKNQVYINGVENSTHNGYKTDMKMNDTMSLLIDCRQQTLRLTNERTRSTYTLEIDITKCPFPWQLNLNLYNPNDRVRVIVNEQ